MLKLSVASIAVALSACAVNVPERHTAMTTPAGLIERAYRQMGGLVVVTGYLRYESRRVELWQSAEAVRTSNPMRSCVVVGYTPRSTGFLRRHNGQMVTVRGYLSQYRDEQGWRRAGNCNTVGLELLPRDF